MHKPHHMQLLQWPDYLDSHVNYFHPEFKGFSQRRVCPVVIPEGLQAHSTVGGQDFSFLQVLVKREP
jgi:hypothetical protein